MRALTVLIVGVSFVFGAQASEWTLGQQAGRAAMQQHDYNTAARIFGNCVSLSTTADERASSLASYGIALNRADRNTEAKAALEQALATAEAQGREDRIVITGVLASVDRSLGDYRSSERLLRTAIADASASQGTRAALMLNLVDLLREETRGTEASAILNEASQLPGLSREQQTSVLVETAELAREAHLWGISIAAWNKIAEIANSEESPRLEELYAGGLGETWFAAGDLARAEPLLRRSLQLLRNDRVASASQVAVALSLMARLYIAGNKLALAEEALDEALAKDENSLGPSHPQIAMLLELRADILSRRGETQPARDDLEQAKLFMSSHFGTESSAVAGVAAALGDVEQRANRPAVAAAQYGVAMRLFRQAGTDSVHFGSALVARYAAALKAAHRPDEARALLATGAPSLREK